MNIISRLNEIISEFHLLKHPYYQAWTKGELTQASLSSKLHMNQEAISRLERRSDLLLSTLISYIEAMGGELNITAKFPHRPPIKVTGFEGIGTKTQNDN